MILSASRRTDIPSFYLDWFCNRLEQGFFEVRNPVNPRRVSRVLCSPQNVDGIVFWSKNPAPLLQKLEALAPYPFYVQFTLNPYGPKLESALPPLEKRLDTFLRLAQRLGPHRVLWRYSPLVLTEKLTPEWHLDAFGAIAKRLSGATRQCLFSYLDVYKKIAPAMAMLGVVQPDEAAQAALAAQLLDFAAGEGIAFSACGSPALAKGGVPAAKCVDAALLGRIGGFELTAKKDPGQRQSCGCDASVDIGCYDSCKNGCLYCYANRSAAALRKTTARYRPDAPMLCDRRTALDQLSLRQGATQKKPARETGQLSFL